MKSHKGRRDSTSEGEAESEGPSVQSISSTSSESEDQSEPSSDEEEKRKSKKKRKHKESSDSESGSARRAKKKLKHKKKKRKHSKKRKRHEETESESDSETEVEVPKRHKHKHRREHKHKRVTESRHSVSQSEESKSSDNSAGGERSQRIKVQSVVKGTTKVTTNHGHREREYYKMEHDGRAKEVDRFYRGSSKDPSVTQYSRHETNEYDRDRNGRYKEYEQQYPRQEYRERIVIEENESYRHHDRTDFDRRYGQKQPEFMEFRERHYEPDRATASGRREYQPRHRVKEERISPRELSLDRRAPPRGPIPLLDEHEIERVRQLRRGQLKNGSPRSAGDRHRHSPPPRERAAHLPNRRDRDVIKPPERVRHERYPDLRERDISRKNKETDLRQESSRSNIDRRDADLISRKEIDKRDVSRHEVRKRDYAKEEQVRRAIDRRGMDESNVERTKFDRGDGYRKEVDRYTDRKETDERDPLRREADRRSHRVEVDTKTESTSLIEKKESRKFIEEEREESRRDRKRDVERPKRDRDISSELEEKRAKVTKEREEKRSVTGKESGGDRPEAAREKEKSGRTEERKGSKRDKDEESRSNNKERERSRSRERPRERRNRFNRDERERETHEWGKKEIKAEKDSGDKEKPNFALSGALAAAENTANGVVIKYTEPPEAKLPKRRWRLYPFKGEKALPILYIHRLSSFLIGREKAVCDIPLDHPSISKQHAALQYRALPFSRKDGTTGKRVRPYVIDLESANGTFVNNVKIEARRYVELFERDVIKFAFSEREYVLLHENSKDDHDDDDDGANHE